MKDSELLSALHEIDQPSCQALVDACRALLPDVSVGIVDISDIPGLEDTEPSLTYDAEQSFEVDSQLVQIVEMGDECGTDIKVTITSVDQDTETSIPIVTRKYYSVTTENANSSYYERTGTSLSNHRPSDAVDIDSALDGMSLAESLGATIFTNEKLDYVLGVLSKCGPHNTVQHRY